MSEPKDRDRAFLGHPLGLLTLFLTEMFERFSYYGMRAFLIFYITASAAKGGLGMGAAGAGIVMALYTASVYMLSLPGGWIADRFLGQRRAVALGGIAIMAGNTLLAIPMHALFYPGLAIIAIGTGLLKPNVSTLVGQLYGKDDNRRDSGFTIYYLGINLGAFFAPFACGFLAQSETFQDWLRGAGVDPTLCWHFAFGAVAVGMLGGLGLYTGLASWLGEAGLRPTIPTDPVKAARDRTILTAILGALGGLVVLFVFLTVLEVDVSGELIGNIFGLGLLVGAILLFVGMYQNALDHEERKRVIAMIPLFVGGIAFFGTFEQASTTLNLFADEGVQRIVPASYFQTINAAFILALAPVFAWMWMWMARNRKEPSSVNKFAWGMILTALAFVVLLPTLGNMSDIKDLHDTLKGDALDHAVDPLRVSPVYLLALYFFQTTSELCISPVGLSSMSKLAPARMAGMVMGTWFLATAIGNYLAGRAAGLTADKGFGFLFVLLIIVSWGVAAGLFAIAPTIKMMLGAPEAAPLPKATAKSAS